MHCLEISLCDQCSRRSDQTCVIQSMLTSDFQAYSHYSNKNPFYGNVFKDSKPTHQHYQLKSLVDQPQDHWLILSGWYSTLTFSVVCSSFSKKNIQADHECSSHPWRIHGWNWTKSPKWKGTSSEPSTLPFCVPAMLSFSRGLFLTQPIQLRSQLIKGVDIQKPT